MTTILAKLISESGYDLKIDVAAKNGYRLRDHTQFIEKSRNRGIGYGKDTTIATSMQKIINGQYDFIILQDPDWLIQNDREENLYQSILYIDSLTKTLTKSKLLFYQPAPLFEEPVTLCYGCNIKYTGHAPDSIKKGIEYVTFSSVTGQMDTIIKVGNEIKYKIAPGSNIVPTGEIISELKQTHPALKMTSPGGHPTKEVQYTLAVTFYTYLTQNDPRDINWNYKIKDTLASEIKALVYKHLKPQKTTHNNGCK